jgi:CHAT domain-containing protein/Tfp pilus assembly protein PilF
MPEQTKNNELRNYLLGNTTLETEKEQIEEKLMLDGEYFELLRLVEEELIQEYADDELTSAEHEKFEKYLLISQESRKKVKFSQVFSRHINKQNNPSTIKDMEARKKSRLSFFRSFLSSPLPVAAAVLVVSLTTLGWYFYSRASETEVAMASLNRAYQTARPFESRITDFDYAPFGTVRGGNDGGGEGKDRINLIERDRAERVLLDDVTRRQNAENLHALGRLYLAKGMFDRAVEQFQKAQTFAPANAEIPSDLGAALFEKNKTISESDREKNPQLSFLALENFEKAIELNPNLLEARFNRAACLEALNLPNQAKEAWQKYLELDSTSKWAEEARRHLQSLETGAVSELSADEMEKEFMTAFLAGRDDEAYKIASLNREIIKEKYLPQKLTFSIVEAEPEERNSKLEALRYFGELEKRRIGDFFSADLANFYYALPETKFALIRRAQAAMKRGYKLCLKEDDFSQALNEFQIAKNFFLQSGNTIEANTLSRYFIAYCLYNLDRRGEAHKQLEKINDFAERKNYKWFALMNFYWLLGSQESLGLKTITETRSDYETSLQKSLAMEDNYTAQKFLLSLILKSHFVKQEKKTFVYLQKILAFSNQPNLSVRQKFRNLDKIVEITASSNFNALSKALVLESVALAGAMTDPAFIVGSEINAGIVHTRTENYDEAERWFWQAKQSAKNLSEQAERNSNLARIFLHEGHLEKTRKNYQKAVEHYDVSLDISGKMNTPLQLYETKKSRLLAYQALGDEEKVERDILPTIELAEEYRKKILDEQERNSFFDNQQSVFDIAVEHEIQKNRFERAYDYAESANSRSLLDWLQKGASVTAHDRQAKILFDDSVTPLKIGEIRKKLPPETEILQFTVLENKVLIWLISKEKFLLVISDTNSKELEAKINKYLELIKTRKSDAQNDARDVSRELYRALIEPVLPYLSKGKEICLIPNKFLFYLPFASLVSPEDKFLLEEFVISYAPSANVFISCTENARNKILVKDERLLSIGNPAFDSHKLPDLADLPESRLEAQVIAKDYRESKVFCGGEASKDSFLSNYQNYDVIHFAGHYLAQPDSPLSSKLVMAKKSETERDNFVTNVELLNEKLPRAKLVVLSACQTGVEGYYDGEGSIGLARTFLAAGVPLVVASQWNVDSAGTYELMKKFHYYRRKGNLSSSRALRQSQLDMLSGSDKELQSPYFWAGFAVFGGYANF